jgi:hypothetical protein
MRAVAVIQTIRFAAPFPAPLLLMIRIGSSRSPAILIGGFTRHPDWRVNPGQSFS